MGIIAYPRACIQPNCRPIYVTYKKNDKALQLQSTKYLLRRKRRRGTGAMQDCPTKHPVPGSQVEKVHVSRKGRPALRIVPLCGATTLWCLWCKTGRPFTSRTRSGLLRSRRQPRPPAHNEKIVCCNLYKLLLAS